MMKIKIWSDIRCPFCYIGKRKFEMALEKFSHRDDLKIEWKSFELDPDLITTPEVNATDHLSEIKGITKKQAEEMQSYVSQVAKGVGLDFNIDKSIIANSFDAHRLIQFAKSKDLANEAGEALFKAHFMEGKNIDDTETLVKTGVDIGLDKDEILQILGSDQFDTEVRQDELQAHELGIHGVPFFVLNDKYAVSGAQSPDTFLKALEQAWKNFEEGKKPVIISEGNSCSVDGNCD